MAEADAKQPRRRSNRPAKSSLPGTTDAVDIAMASIARDPSADNPARRLLEEQAGLIAAQRKLVEADCSQRRLQTWSERIGVALKLSAAFVALIVVGLFGLMVYQAARSQNVVIDPFFVSPAMAAQGYSGEVAAAALSDELTRLQDVTRINTQRRSVTNAWDNDIAVQLPQTGISIGEMRRLLTAWLGSDTHIAGSLSRAADGQVALTVRGDGVPARTFVGPASDVAALSVRAAEHAYASSQPTEYMTYLMQAGRNADAIAFAPAALAAADEDEQVVIMSRWAQSLSVMGRHAEGRERAMLAHAMNPYAWAAYGPLSGSLLATDEERAIRVFDVLRARAAEVPSRPQPTIQNGLDEHIYRNNWTFLVDFYRADTGGEGTVMISTNPSLAEAEAFRHDPVRARRHILVSNPGDRALAGATGLVAGFAGLDAGRPDRAIAGLERLASEIAAKPDLARYYFGYQCYLGLAYALAGRFADADRVFEAAPRSGRCRALRADTLALRGDRRAAETLYLEAIRTTPSLPIVWERAGHYLLARGDARQALNFFATAVAKGPGWAEPYKGRGDALVRLRRDDAAAGQYARAAELAPRWGALHLAWAETLHRLGRVEEARARAGAARAMVMSDADRAHLTRLVAALR